MSEPASRYQFFRSHGDVYVFLICREDQFYTDVPKAVRLLGPWRGLSRGEVDKLKPEYRVTLARDGYVLVRADEALLKPEA